MGAPTGAATTPFSGWPVCISNHPSFNGHHLLSHGKSHRNGVSRPRKKIRLSNNKNAFPTLRKGNKNSQHPLKEEFKWKKNHPPHTTGKRSEVPFFWGWLARTDTAVTIFVPSFSIIKLCKLWILRHGSLCPTQTHTHTHTLADTLSVLIHATVPRGTFAWLSKGKEIRERWNSKTLPFERGNRLNKGVEKEKKKKRTSPPCHTSF